MTVGQEQEQQPGPAGHDHAVGGGCCSDTPEKRARLAKARRLVALTGLGVVALVLVGIAVGGRVGAAVLMLVAAGILVTTVSRWRTLSINDRLLPVAMSALLVAVALLRAFPR